MSKLLVTGMVVWTLVFPVGFASADTAAPELKSRDTAFALSLGGTFLSLSITAVGAGTENGPLLAAGMLSSLIAPSAGEIYAGEWTTPGLGIRVLSAGAGYAGVGVALKCLLVTSPCEKHEALAVSLITAGAVGYVSGILYDIATAGAVVDRHNRQVQFQVAPLVSTSSGVSAGLSLGGSF